MKTTSPHIRWLRLICETAPVLSLVSMLVLPQLLKQVAPDERTVLARHVQVKKAVDDAPWTIGSWIGEEMAVPAATVEILRPNSILSRRFQSYAGVSVELLIVHCSDARDMQGHFPPICYPANGWVENTSFPESQQTVLVGNQSLDLRVYHFDSADALGSTKNIRVFNCFVLPDGRTTSDYHIVSSLGKRYSTSIQGIGQVQLVVDAKVSLDESIKAASELLTGVQEILAVLSQGGNEPCLSQP